MASTYSPNLRLELIGTGEQQGTWGTTTNTNLGTLLEEAIGGYVSVTVTDGADTTLTTVNGGADQSRNMTINLTGTLTAARNVICPAIEKLYVVNNATTGGFAVTFKVSGQTGVSVPNGATVLLYVDGTDARTVTGSLASQTASNVSITGGSITGTSVSSSNVTITGGSISNVTGVILNPASVAQGDVLYYSGTSWARLPAGNASQVLTTNGPSANPSWSSAPSSGSATIYTSGSGNWTIPSSKSFVLVRAWGGGGSGAYTATNPDPVGGGGGGAYVDRLYNISDLGSAGSNVSYSVAAGGAAKTATGAGNPGGNTTFSSGATLLTAYGGGVPNTSSPGTGGSPTVYSGGAAGGSGNAASIPFAGAGGASLYGGAGGGSLGRNTSGSYFIAGAGGASSGGGGAGGAGKATSGAGNDGSSPGGGGGGGAGSLATSSGAGGNGRLEIWVW